MGQDHLLHIITCLPVDTSTLPDIGIPIPKPSVEHSITRCKGCQVEVWIGPKQRKLKRLYPAYCILCSVSIVNARDIAMVIPLDTDADDIPRRGETQ